TLRLSTAAPPGPCLGTNVPYIIVLKLSCVWASSPTSHGAGHAGQVGSLISERSARTPSHEPHGGLRTVNRTAEVHALHTEVRRRLSRVTESVALLASLALIGIGFQVAAQGATPADLDVVANADYGDVLATPGGNSLYLYVEDSDGTSVCVDACANNWPALLVGDDGVATAGSGVDQALLGTTTRADGGVQITYNGHPLYTFRRDTAEGTTRGQKLGDAYFLVSPKGDAVTDKLAQQKVAIDP